MRSKQPSDYYRPLHPAVHGSVAELKKGNLAHVEPVIHFLEYDPYTFGTGYLKEKIWRYLLRVSLTKKQEERLRQVALHYVEVRMSREFFPMCRFVSGIATEKFKEQVRVLEESTDLQVRRRAALLAAYFKGIKHGEDARHSL